MVELDPTLRTRLSKYLTLELLAELPSTTAIAQATQNLSSLHKTISSFLPQYVVEDEAHLNEDYGKLSPGTFMFADVSGFTALSEKLMEKAGAEGIEILTKIINDYFSTMLEILAKSNGQLLKFAGDALLTFFPKESLDEFPKAINAGLRMQRAMAEKFQPIINDDLDRWYGQHNLQLTMSIGISRGELFEALVGSINQRDHMIMGKLPGQADAAEKAGVRDEVIIPAEWGEQYGKMFELKPIGEGFLQVVDNFGDNLGDYEFALPNRRRSKSSFLFSFDEDQLVSDLQNELARVETISRFVSSEIVNKLVVRGDHIESENRLATVIFVHFTGFAELLDVWGSENVDNITLLLSQFYSTMRRVIATHGGVLTRTDPYALGSKMLITFGAPVAHPDDNERAVQTGLDMLRQLEAFNIRLKEELPAELMSLFPYIKMRMGITQGNVYAGEVGWKQRREYTVMGDDVNLAARLMGRADFGQIIISRNVWERVNTSFQTESLPLFTAKGKSEPIQSYSVSNIIQEQVATTSSTPFIGRDVILLSLNMSLQQASRGPKRLRALALHGEIGVGKTRLAKELVVSAKSSGFKVAWITCRSQSSPKTAWVLLISQLLDINRHADVERQKAQLSESLSALDLSGLIEPFSSLLFEVEEQARPNPAANRRRNASKSTNDIFKKLSSDNTIASMDDVNSLRQRIKQSYSGTGGKGAFWSDLQLGTSLSESLVKFLKVYTAETHTLIILDDLHKENQRTLNRLKRVMEDLSGAHLMIVATFEPSTDPGIDFHKIAVADLPEDQTLLMASAILDRQELGPKLAKFIWESTNGRALFIESLIQTLVDTDQLVVDGGVYELKPDANVADLPDNVRGLVISRMDRLPADARQMVRAAAVLEDNFSLAELDFISAVDNPNVTQQLFENSDGNIYRFQHGVTQQAVYEELTRLQRQNFHLKVADMYGETDNADTVRKVVHHLQKAGAITRAADYMNKAARRAEEKGDIDQAIENYTISLEIFQDAAVQEQLNRLKQG
jgi:adenylate cyclase